MKYKTDPGLKARRGARYASALAVMMSVLMMLTACGGEEKITATVTVLGNSLTDLTRQQLDAEVSRIASQTPITDNITVSFLGESYDITPDAIGLRYDEKAMADEAYKEGVQSFWDRLFDKEKVSEIPLVTTYDEKALEKAAIEASKALSVDATDFSYELKDDTVTVTKGGQAVALDPNQVFDGVKERLDAMEYTPLDIEGEIPFAPVDLQSIKAELDRPSSNPRLDLAKDPSGQTIAGGQRGINVDLEAAEKAMAESGDNETFSFPVKFIEPTMSVSEFQSMLFRDTLSTVTTNFNAGLAGRTANVKLACDFCNGTILNPGDEFSYNRAVGPRTYARGFKDATIYAGGTTEDGVGGGICQVSSTIYSAALRADLKISERHNHSFMITYVPLGEDATVAYGSKDFRFVNNTNYPIKVKVTYGKSSMTVTLIGTNVSGKKVELSTKQLSSTPFQVVYQEDPTLPAGTTKVKNNGFTGYVTETYRLVYQGGKLISSNFENKSVYTKLDKVILQNTTAPAPAPEPEPSAEPVPDPSTPSAVDSTIDSMIPEPAPAPEPSPEPAPDPAPAP